MARLVKSIKSGSNVTGLGEITPSDTVEDALIFADNVALKFGTNSDVSILYDESTDDRLEISGGEVYVDNTLRAKRGVGATHTFTTSGTTVTLDFATYQNFVITLGHSITLANPSTEAVGQAGFIVFIQDGTGSRTVSVLGTDYETAAGAGLTLSSAASTTDIVPYIVAASGRILLGAPQLAFA